MRNDHKEMLTLKNKILDSPGGTYPNYSAFGSHLKIFYGKAFQELLSVLQSTLIRSNPYWPFVHRLTLLSHC